MKPRLKPVKGWNFRAILIFSDGKVFFDDVQHVDQLGPLIARMIQAWKKEGKY